MADDYENMTMEEYFTSRANSVQEAIITHCDEVCKMITAQYEQARSKKLGIYDMNKNTSQAEMVVKLEVIAGPHKGQVFPIRPKSMMYPLIGRSTSDKVQKYGISLPKDSEVSSYHGKFFIRGGQLKYKDTNSTNHSFVNEEMVTEDVTLKTGDILLVGQTELKITIQKMG